MKTCREYVAALRDSSDTALASEDHVLDDDILLGSLLEYRWLRAKFRFFDFESSRLSELLVKELGPETVFTPVDFERLVRSAFQLVFERSFEMTPRSNDGGIDLINVVGFESDGGSLVASATTVVQCKYYSGFVPVSELRDFLGVMTAGTATGYFVTTGKLTRSGFEFLSRTKSSTLSNRLHFVGGKEFLAVIECCDQIANLVFEERLAADARHRAVALWRERAIKAFHLDQKRWGQSLLGF